jgi:hypothetical protein
VRRLIVAVGIVVLAASCTGNEEKRAPTAAQSREPQVAIEGLCEAETLAAGGLQSEARGVFQNQSHAYLHELAAQLEERDRVLAGQLLEAKQEVEVALQKGSDPETLALRIGALRAVVESAVAVVGLTNVGCFK